MINLVLHLSIAASHYSQLAHGMPRALDELPDAVLKDIGLARSDIPFIAGKLVYKCKDPARDDPIDRFRLERGVAERDDPPFARNRPSSHACGSSHCFGCFRSFIRRPGLADGSMPK